MGLYARAHDIIVARANRALDMLEDPSEMLDLSYEKMLDQLAQVRRALSDVGASRESIELQLVPLGRSIERLQEQAQTAVDEGRYDLAKEALSRKAAEQAQRDGMESQLQQLAELEQKLTETVQTLQERVDTFRARKEVLKAEYAASRATASANAGLAGISTATTGSGNVPYRPRYFGSARYDIDAELALMARTKKVDEELAKLKAAREPAAKTPTGTSTGATRRVEPTGDGGQSPAAEAPASSEEEAEA